MTRATMNSGCAAKTASLAAVLVAALALTGCSGGAAASKPDARAWNDIFAGPDARTLYVSVAEDTLNRDNSCWQDFTTAARWTGHAFVVTVSGSYPHPANHAACPAVAVPAYAVVHLPQRYAGQPVRDATTGEVHKVLPAVHPPANEIVNSAS